MLNRGNTLLGVLLITLFLSGLAYFSYRNPFSQILAFTVENQVALPSFPMQKKLKAAANLPKGADSVSLEELFGERTELLVNFWATWCPPCLEELPSLEYLGRQLNAKDNKNAPLLVTISVDEDPKEVPKLLKTLDFSASFIVLHDPEGEVSLGMGTSKFPETYLINRQGKVLKKWIGPQNWLSSNIIQSLTLNSSH